MRVFRIAVMVSALVATTLASGCDEDPVVPTDTTTTDTTTADTATDTTAADTHGDTASDAADLPLLRVFVAAGYEPVVAGVSGADAYCMAHTDYPGTGTFKAFLGGPSRQACSEADCVNGTGHVDWILAAERDYGRAADSLALWSTDANALITFPMANEIIGSTNFLSGFDKDWTLRDIHCDDWTSTSGDAPVGWTSTLGDSGFLSGGKLKCTGGTILCVEQP